MPMEDSWADDLAATPQSGISLTPPSPRWKAEAGLEPELDGLADGFPIANGFLDDPVPAGPVASVPVPPDQPDGVDSLFACLDAANTSQKARRGRPRRVLRELEERLAAERAPPPVVEVADVVPIAPELDDVEVGGGDAVAAVALVLACPAVVDNAPTPAPAGQVVQFHVGVLDGYAVLSPLADDVTKRIDHLISNPRAVSEAIATLCQDKLRSGVYEGLIVEATRRGIPPKTLHMAKYRWAMSLLADLASARLAIEHDLATTRRLDLAHFLEWQRYDETPLPLRVMENFSKMLADGDAECGEALALLGMGHSDDVLSLSTNSSTKKILQTDQSFGFVLELCVGSYMILMACVPSPLLLIESESGPVMTHAIQRNVGTTRFAQSFHTKHVSRPRTGTPVTRGQNATCSSYVPVGWRCGCGASCTWSLL